MTESSNRTVGCPRELAAPYGLVRSPRFQTVPVEPTPEMLQAGNRVNGAPDYAREVWAAMLDAAEAAPF